MSSPLNLVLICLDTFRADCVAAAKRNPAVRTPNLDRLFAEGVYLENAFGEGQPTIHFRRALCTGMRSFPYTRQYDVKGLWPHLPGWHRIPPEQPTMAELLLDQGYATGFFFSTYHMGKPTMNFTRGMTSWEFIRGMETDNARSGPLDNIDILRHYRKDCIKPHAILTLAQYLLNNQDRKTDEDHIPARLFNRAIQFVEDHARYQPFFLWIDSFDCHEPWDPPREYADVFDPDWDEDWEPIFGHREDMPEKVRRRSIANYYGEVLFVDKYIGRLLDTLEARGLMDNTVIFVTSDHGCELWDHGSPNKQDHRVRYRHNAEILGLLRFPGGEHAGKRVRPFVLSHDIFPTLLDILGVRRPPVDGENFLPLVTGEKESLRDRFVGAWAGTGIRVSVRDHEWAYSRDFLVDEPNPHLFHISEDPGETTNVADCEPDVVADRERTIADYLGGRPAALPITQDPMIVPARNWMMKAPWAKELRELAEME